MFKHSTTPRNHGRQRSLTFEDGLTIWRARDTYRVQTVVYGILGLVLLVPPLVHLLAGEWGSACGVIGLEVLVIAGIRWLWRTLRAWSRARWHGLVLVLM